MKEAFLRTPEMNYEYTQSLHGLQSFMVTSIPQEEEGSADNMSDWDD